MDEKAKGDCSERKIKENQKGNINQITHSQRILYHIYILHYVITFFHT